MDTSHRRQWTQHTVDTHHTGDTHNPREGEPWTLSSLHKHIMWTEGPSLRWIHHFAATLQWIGHQLKFTVYHCILTAVHCTIVQCTTHHYISALCTVDCGLCPPTAVKRLRQGGGGSRGKLRVRHHTLHCTALHCTALHCTALGQNNTSYHFTTQHCTGQHITVQDNTALYRTTQHCTGQHSTVQDNTALYRTSTV